MNGPLCRHKLYEVTRTGRDTLPASDADIGMNNGQVARGNFNGANRTDTGTTAQAETSVTACFGAAFREFSGGTIGYAVINGFADGLGVIPLTKHNSCLTLANGRGNVKISGKFRQGGLTAAPAEIDGGVIPQDCPGIFTATWESAGAAVGAG